MNTLLSEAWPRVVYGVARALPWTKPVVPLWMRRTLYRAYRSGRPLRKDYRHRFNMTLKDWLLYHQREIVFTQCSWMGVPAFKNPLDSWTYQEIIYAVKPDVIVEIGSAYGGSTLYFAHLLDVIGKGQVISIDIDRSRYRAEHERIVALTGDSSSPPILEAVSDICRGKSVLVVHDGDHRKEQVLRDLRAYAPFVSIHSYLIVEDGLTDIFRFGDGIGGYEDGPLVAIEQFVRENPDFVIDAEKERYILTYNPKGYLKRVRH